MREGRKEGRVVVVPRDLIRSRAYWSLRNTAPQVLSEFLARRQIETRDVKVDGKREKQRVIVNQGEITFT